MAKKKVDLLKYLRISKKYRDVPSDVSDQYGLITYAYPHGYIWGKGGGISLEEAHQSNERILYRVAQSIVERSHKKISKLSGLQRLILEQLDKIEKSKNEMDIERLYIMIEHAKNEEISDELDIVSKRILGNSLYTTFLN